MARSAGDARRPVSRRAMRWGSPTSFFQTLIDMKNSATVIPGQFEREGPRLPPRPGAVRPRGLRAEGDRRAARVHREGAARQRAAAQGHARCREGRHGEGRPEKKKAAAKGRHGDSPRPGLRRRPIPRRAARLDHLEPALTRDRSGPRARGRGRPLAPAAMASPAPGASDALGPRGRRGAHPRLQLRHQPRGAQAGTYRPTSRPPPAFVALARGLGARGRTSGSGASAWAAASAWGSPRRSDRRRRGRRRRRPGHATYFADQRVIGVGAGATVFDVLVRIPIGTAVCEELIFRGALLGVLLRHRTRSRPW